MKECLNYVNKSKNEVVLDGVTYKIGYNLRTQIIYERLTKDAGSTNVGTLEIVIFFYSSLLAHNDDTFNMSFGEFIETLDKGRKILGDFSAWSKSYFDRLKELEDEPEPVEGTDLDKKKD